jgi:hypothetical protein
MQTKPTTERRAFPVPSLIEVEEPGRSLISSLHHLSRAMAVLAVAALLAVGCSGSPFASNKPSPRTAEDQALKYTQCLQQHGINAQSSSNGSGTAKVRVGGPGTQGSGQQQLQAAQAACKKYQPNGGQAAQHPSAQQMDQAAKFAQCMNQHGVPAQANNGNVSGNESGTDPSKMQQAQQACQHYLNGSGSNS